MRRALPLAALLAMLASPPAWCESALAVIVSVHQADTPLDLDELALIYARKRQFWPDGRRIQPINLAAEHPLRLRFSRAVFKAPPATLDSYWNEQYFHGVRPPYVVASDAAMLRLVSNTAGAIGYVDACRASDEVRIVGFIDAEAHWRRVDALPAECGAAPP